MPSNSNALHRKGFRQLMKIAAIAIFGFALAGYGVWAYAQERHDLPPFDQEKAKTLSPEKRAEYDRLLFNELAHWSGGTRRHNLYTREAEWQMMAADGHELSYWMLQTRSPTKGRFSNTRALKRLQELAEQGDASAMCAYGWVLGIQPNKADPRYVKAVDYIKRGTALGHPECQRRLGSYYLGVAAPASQTGIPFNKQRGFELLVESARVGYTGAGDLWAYFDRQGLSNAENIKRTYCWSAVNEQYEPSRPENMTLKVYLLTSAKDYAAKNKRLDILSLVKQLQNTQPTLEQCIELGPN